MKNMKMLPVLLLCILALTLPTVAAEPEASTLPPVYVGVQKLEAIPESWHPLQERTQDEDLILSLTGEPLYRLGDEGTFVPAQAAAMPLDVTAEYAGSFGIPKTARRGYAFAISIRGGACWENGEAVTAKDWYYTAGKLLEQGRFPLELGGYREFVAGGTKPSEKIVSLMEAGFDSAMEAEAAGHSDFYIDVTGFWGLEEGWLRVTDKTPLTDAAMPSGCTEMYLTAEYLYRNYLAQGASQEMFQTEFVGIPVTEGEKLTMEDVGLICKEDTLVIILCQPTAPSYLAMALSGLYVAREADFGSCGPYRVASSTDSELVLEPNPLWTGEQPPYKTIRFHAG